MPRGRLTLTVVRAALVEMAERRADPNLHLVDGLELYGPQDAITHPLPDALHPDADSHRFIGARFAKEPARFAG